MNHKSLLLSAACGLILAGCAQNPPGRPQVLANPDKISALLADAADRASASLETLAAIESQKRDVAASPQISSVPPELKRGITVNWIGPVGPIAEKLASRASYTYKVFGSEPASPVVVSIDAENQPLVEVLRDIGLQLGQNAELHVNAAEKIVEIRYATPFQNLDEL